MRKYKFLIFAIIVSLMIQSGLPVSALSSVVSTNQYTHPDIYDESWTINQLIPANYQKVSENELYVLYANAETLAFKVVDKRSNYVWHSNLDEVTEADDLNKKWTAFAQSGISIDYITNKASIDRLDITRDNPNIQFTLTDNGFSAKVSYALYGLGYSVMVTLEPTGIHVEIPKTSIVQTMPEYKMQTIHLYPFFGATIKDVVPGYFFIPDGSGALLRFSDRTEANSMFYGRYYGTDLGMTSENRYQNYINAAYNLTMPIYGMVHGVDQHAYTVIIDQGAAYGRLRLHQSGVTTQFNFVYNSFIYNEAYFQATNRSGAGVDAIQKKSNEFNVSMHYRFLDGNDSDYVGMALDYQQYLKDKGDLNLQEDQDEHIGVRLEFLGAEKKRFLFWDIPLTMTTLAQMSTILSDLKSKGISNTEVVYYGWQPLGASQLIPTTFKLESKLGSVSALKTLISDIEENSGTFSLYVNPQVAFRNSSGFTVRTDLAMSITNKNLLTFDQDKVSYLFNLKNVTKRLNGLDKLTLPTVEFAVGSLGYNLYSDFKSGNFLNREEAISAYRTIFDEMDHSTSFYSPNDYLFKFTRNYYDTPVTNSGYVYTKDTVPFLQILLSGYVSMYSTPLNFSSDLPMDRLRLVDFNVYPSFYLTKDATSKILNTKSNWIYSSAYDQWGSLVVSTYQYIDERLSQVAGATIVDRHIPIDGISVIDYSNGMTVVVNYTSSAYMYENNVVLSRDAVCVRTAGND